LISNQHKTTLYLIFLENAQSKECENKLTLKFSDAEQIDKTQRMIFLQYLLMRRFKYPETWALSYFLIFCNERVECEISCVLFKLISLCNLLMFLLQNQ
jgi:hypothetical protein